METDHALDPRDCPSGTELRTPSHSTLRPIELRTPSHSTLRFVQAQNGGAFIGSMSDTEKNLENHEIDWYIVGTDEKSP